MSLNIYMDVHVPSAITRALRRRGIDVLTAQDDGTGEIDDSVLLDRAAEIGRILFTRDDDLLAIAVQRWRQKLDFATVVYAHQLHVTIGACVADLELIAKAGFSEDGLNHVFFLPL